MFMVCVAHPDRGMWPCRRTWRWRLGAVLLCMMLAGTSVPAWPAESASTEAPAARSEVVLAPFLVPLPADGSGADLLVCRLALCAEDGPVQDEIREKMRLLRDALYYYLRHRGGQLLRAEKGMAAVQEELAIVASSHLERGRVAAVRLEYLPHP